MRVATAAFAIAGVALGLGLLARPAEDAAAEYNINGEWTFYIGGIYTCQAIITQTDTGDYLHPIVIAVDPCFLSYVATLDTRTGYLSGFDTNGASSGITGVVSNNGHTISGDIFSRLGGAPILLTGGAGDPKFPTPTATPCAGPCATTTATATGTATPTQTPRPVGGAAFDAPTSGGGAFDAWWAAAVAAAAFVTLGGAALYARRRA